MFEIQKNNPSIINKWNGTKECVFVPSFFEKNNVTELAPYCFYNHREIKKICLPNTLKKIGNHCFYDCRSLEEIEIGNTTKEIEDGAFKNCTSLKKIILHVITNKLTCLKSLMTELNQQIEVQFLYEVGEEVRLVFPKYLYDYEENTQARIINQITYGMGVHYRECIKEQEVDLKSYDKIFKTAKATEKIETIEILVLNRLRFPRNLSQEAKKEYEAFFIENREKIAQDLVKRQEGQLIKFILQTEMSDYFTELFLRLSQKCNYVEGIAITLNENKNTSIMKQKTFDL